jgi:hypothetical protein
MKKILLLSAVLLGAATVSQAGGLHLSIGLPLPPLPGISITAPAPVYAPPVCPPVYTYGPAYSYGPAYCPPVVSFGFGYPYYGRGYYGGYYRGGGYYRDGGYYHGGGYYRGGGYYHGGYRGGYHHYR